MDTDAALGDEWAMARITEEKLAAARAKICARGLDRPTA